MSSLSLPFKVFDPKNKRVPILVSSPHSGTAFPKSLENRIHEKFLESPPDTDWHINKLYDFVPDMGITLICARYSRYVIDLNRDPHGPLYEDGRTETELVPVKSFTGESLYIQGNPDSDEVMERKLLYYDPYYAMVAELLEELLDDFGQALFFDAHSIKHVVRSISPDPFPDLILGHQFGQSCSEPIARAAAEVLGDNSLNLSFSENQPFSGGNLTRHFGSPSEGIHGLQLEMCQHNYMDESSLEYLPKKADSVRELLRKMFGSLTEAMEKICEV